MMHPAAAAECPQRLCSIPLFRPVADRLWARLGSHAGFAEVKGLISLEPGIAAELLTAANSRVYGYASSVYTIEESMFALGWEEVKQLIRAAVAADCGTDGIEPLVRASWSHTVATAFAAAELAGIFGMSADRAYALGLLHDIGRFGLMGTSPEAYEQVFAMRCGNPLEFLGAEQIALGMDHAKAGSWLARSWGLPAEFSEVAETHHELVLDPGRQTAILAALACGMAHTAGFSFGPPWKMSVKTALSNAPARLRKQLQCSWSKIRDRSRAKLLEAFLCCLHPDAQTSGGDNQHAG